MDNLDTYIIELIRPYIVPVMTHIVNTSISTHIFPTAYKIAKVSKIIESVIQQQITTYMNDSQLFNPNHHAY